MRTLVLGAVGQLGSKLCKVMKDCDLIPTTRIEVDITRLAQVIEFIEHLRPEAIINASAYTDVDDFENYKRRRSR
jgi:dTDP-4-dehydrorhamnose reductase